MTMVRPLQLIVCVCSEASKYLVDVLGAVSDADREECLEKLVEAVQKQPCKVPKFARKQLLFLSVFTFLDSFIICYVSLFAVKSAMIDRRQCESAVQECNQEQDDERYSDYAP